MSFVKVCELLALEKQVAACGWKVNGRPPKSQLKMAHAFVAKALWNIPSTQALIGQLKSNTTLRRLCGWQDWPRGVTSESIFCRAFAAIGLGERAHQTLIAPHLGKEVIWNAATDATAIVAREKVVKEPQTEPAGETPADDVSRRKRGRPRKSHDPPPPDPTKLQRHLAGTLAANLQDMPDVRCNHGCKTNSQGNTDDWRGYKLYLVTGDGDIPYYFFLIASFWAQRSVI